MGVVLGVLEYLKDSRRDFRLAGPVERPGKGTKERTQETPFLAGLLSLLRVAGYLSQVLKGLQMLIFYENSLNCKIKV